MKNKKIKKYTVYKCIGKKIIITKVSKKTYDRISKQSVKICFGF